MKYLEKHVKLIKKNLSIIVSFSLINANALNYMVLDKTKKECEFHFSFFTPLNRRNAYSKSFLA